MIHPRARVCEAEGVSVLTSAGRSATSIGVGYVLGTLASADMATRRATGASDAPIDIRTVGSSNPGAMNTAKSIGTRWGTAVFAADLLKGVAASYLGRRIGGPNAANLAATAAVAGHCYPPGRTGGKGVATSLGQVVGTFPYYLPLDIAVAVGTAAIPRWTQRTWVGTATASVVWVASSAVAHRRGWATGVDKAAPVGLPIGAALSSAIIAKRFLDQPLEDGKPIDDRAGDDGSLETVQQ